MKIKEVTSEHILFDDGSEITYNYFQDCCEINYADFEQLDTIARNTEFNSDLVFEKVDNNGFRFGNKPNKMFFVPCYSIQNGYYSSAVDIHYNGKEVLTVYGEVNE